MAQGKYLIVIAGPTAVGKTNLSIKIAKHFETEILSADSRQFFKELNIGTAKPSESELGAVKHHFINNLSIHDQYDVSLFEKEALQILANLFHKQNVAVLTGGSGLYIKTICEGIDEMPDITAEVRLKLQIKLKNEGLESLLKELKTADPKFFAEADIKNATRVLRALEVYYTTGKAYSSFRKKSFEKRSFQVIKIGLERPREELYYRIDSRMDDMIAQGLFSEAETLFPHRQLNALNTVGYKEIFDHFLGNYNKEEAIRLLKRNSRHYAKRQMTWFKKDEEIKWFHPDEPAAIIDYLVEIIK